MTEAAAGPKLDAREERNIAEAAALTLQQLHAAKAMIETTMPSDGRPPDGALLGSVVQAIAINYQTVRRK